MSLDRKAMIVCIPLLTMDRARVMHSVLSAVSQRQRAFSEDIRGPTLSSSTTWEVGGTGGIQGIEASCINVAGGVYVSFS